MPGPKNKQAGTKLIKQKRVKEAKAEKLKKAQAIRQLTFIREKIIEILAKHGNERLSHFLLAPEKDFHMHRKVLLLNDLDKAGNLGGISRSCWSMFLLIRRPCTQAGLQTKRWGKE